MSLEVTIHEAQSSILRELLFVPAAGFAELQKPTGLTSDHFTFHIGRLVELGLVKRNNEGKYHLTTKGKEYANRMDTDERKMERQGKIAVLLVPRRERADGTAEYMVQKRLKQPFYGFYGFMSGKLRWGETVMIGAARELEEETGLSGTLEVKAIHHKMDYANDGRLLEDKHFYLVLATDITGAFKAAIEGGENYWLSLADIRRLENAFAGVDNVAEIAERPGMHFWEQSYEYTEEQY